HLPHLLFLDSASNEPSSLGRYSFVMAAPLLWLQSRGRRILVGDWPRGHPPFAEKDGNPFDLVTDLLAKLPLQRIKGLPPFQGGLAGLWGYDLCHHVERLPRPVHDEFQVPDLAVGVYDWVIGFDHDARRAWLFSTGLLAVGKDRLSQAQYRMRQVRGWLRHSPARRKGPRPFAPRKPVGSARKYPLPELGEIFSNFS